MSNYSNIRQGLASIEALEKELNLKQLQINRLLNITQAINSNVKAAGLFEMYTSFLSWELGVRKMALYLRTEEAWKCTASIGVTEKLLTLDITDQLSNFTRLNNLEENDHPLISKFDIVIPVKHKEKPLAYVFIGGFVEDEDMYNKVQFITTITNIIVVAIENKRLFKQQIEQERLNREMELATDMQQMLIPKKLPKNNNYELNGIYKPHLNVGGDYFDFVEFPMDQKVVFCIGDISGKGLAAALLMANFQANFQGLVSQRLGMRAFVRMLNKAVLKITNGDRFITFFVAEYNIRTRELTYINCGHNPPALAMNNQVYRLKKGCTILGIFDELPSVEIGRLNIEGDAMLLTFTDGLIDIKNKDGEFLDQEYGQEFVLKNAHLTADEFNGKMMKEIEDYIGEEEYPDDFTVLTCKIFE